jgi:flagellar basal body-associated protein FliL
MEFNAKPGETLQQTVKLYDDAMEGVTVYPWVYNFTDDPQKEGAVLVQADPKDFKPDRAWIVFDQPSVTLPADGLLVDFPYRIVLPQNAEPGTHLISLVFRTRPAPKESEGTMVYIGTNVATNIFLRVAGSTIDKLEVNFQAGTFTKKDPTLTPAELKKYFKLKNFFWQPPVDFLLTVKNSGNTHQRPDGNIKVYNDLLGGTPEKLLINREGRIILPGTDRTYDVPSFGQGFMFGKFRAKLTLLYGNPLREVPAVVTFWIVPIELVISFAVLLLLISGLIFWWRQYKKKQARKEKELREQIVREMKGTNKPDQAKAPEKSKSKTMWIIIPVILVVVGVGGAFAYKFLIKNNATTDESERANQNATVNSASHNSNSVTVNTNQNSNQNTNAQSTSNQNMNGVTNVNTTVNTNTATNTAPSVNADSNSNTNSAAADFDKDGLTDADELKYGTDPMNPDTDGDSYTDGIEVQQGHNPLGSD